tara:strand:- start:175 stop:615 length:441 start_codon:yes stop_codon:yes gene_type:complete
MAYGFAGAPTVQHLRDYGFTSVKGIGPGNIVGAIAEILPDVSSLPGCDANSQYIVWGVICATARAASANPFHGYLIATGVAHTTYAGAGAGSDDDAVILSFACSKEGPFFWSTDHPIGLPKGAGLSLDALGHTANNVVYVYYSIKT